MDLNKTRSNQGLLRSPVSPPKTPPLPSISLKGKEKVDKLIDQVDNITLSDSVITSKTLEPYVTWCRDACSNSEVLKYAVERFHYYWRSNRSAVVKAALFLCANWMFEADGVKLRNELLLCVQKDFDSRLDLQAKSPEIFLNATAFLIEMYTRIRIDNLPMTFITTPVFQYLQDLLTGDDSEIELFAHLVIGIVPTLQEVHAAGGGGDSTLTSFGPLQKLFSKVRSTLTSRNLSSQSRLWLLFIVDVSSSGDFRQPSSSLQTFYQDKDNLGSSVGFLLKSLEITDLTEGNASVLEAQQQESIENEQVRAGHLSEIKSSPQSKEPKEIKESKEPKEIKEPKQLKEPMEPKELKEPHEFKEASEKTLGSGLKKRSPGKNETVDKRENFRSALFDNSKGYKGKSYWLHDDRFEKDDEKSAGSFSKPRASEGNWRRPSTPKDDKESKSTNDGNWRQPQKIKTQDNRESATPIQTDVLAYHKCEENWDE